jgi:hypothetical protein
VRRWVAVLTMVAACGGDGTAVRPDADTSDVMPDAFVFPACSEFAATAVSLPVHINGTLSGTDVQSPTECAAADAPYGIASAGPDSVIALAGLTPGKAYIVQLQSPADLGFYVTNGCSTMTGPSPSECQLFVDASADTEEVGRFVASGTTAYVVVDYYASATPGSQRFTLDVYAEACIDDAGCSGTTPVCHHGRCVVCADSFDCPSTQAPRCEGGTNLCAAGVDECTADDASEPANDGPAGAVVLTPDTNGAFTTTGQICSSPRSEADFFKLDVANGETWDFTLAWTGDRDLDLEIFDATGEQLGLSFWENPETVRLAYLPAGTYYVTISDFTATTTAPVGYTLSGQRVSTTGCTTRADCAANYRNQIFRGTCDAGACVPITATGLITGQACDTEDDCAANLACPDFYFVANADTRSVCAPHCTADIECVGLGNDYVCTSYLLTGNFCIQKCSTDDQCPTDPTSDPATGPWFRLTCQVSTGRCILP